MTNIMGGPNFPSPYQLQQPQQWRQTPPPAAFQNNFNGPVREAPPTQHSAPASLQKQFPGEYARLAQRMPVKDSIENTQQTWDALQRLRNNTPLKDQQLVIMNDQAKMTGSLLIATLATLGLKQRVFGTGEYLGFLSWFGAMAATPAIINGMVQTKTGLNLNQLYDSTYGQKQNLFKDPHYLPLHILPDREINRIADKLGIPPGQNRRQLTEEKIRQISVQTHTWWMLVAGPATPVVSGLICDALQDPALRGVNQIKKAWKGLRTNWTLRAENPNQEALARKTQAYLEQLVGELPEAELSSWWKSFGADIARKTGLVHAFSAKDLKKDSRNSLIERMITHFENNRPGKELMDYLDQQYTPASETKPASGQLEALRAKAETFLFKAKAKLSAEAYEEQQRFIDRRILNAESTVNHYRSLFQSVEAALKNKPKLNPADKNWLRALIQDTNINTVQSQLNAGYADVASKLVGEESIFNKVSASLRSNVRQFKAASDMMGASPEKHLFDDALKNVKLRGLWRKRMVGYLGGGLLAATALYNYFFIGRNFNPQSKSAGGDA